MAAELLSQILPMELQEALAAAVMEAFTTGMAQHPELMLLEEAAVAVQEAGVGALAAPA